MVVPNDLRKQMIQRIHLTHIGADGFYVVQENRSIGQGCPEILKITLHSAIYVDRLTISNPKKH